MKIYESTVIRQKQRAHRKARSTGIKRDVDRYKRLQHDVQYQIRPAHKDYMKTAVGDTFKENPKKFWSFVKNTGQEATGVSPLKNKDRFLKSDSASKANILNNHFVSLFTKKDTSSFPDEGPSPFPSMPNIEVNWKEVHKLLKGIKPLKAIGPDYIPAFILKEAADQPPQCLQGYTRLLWTPDKFHQIGEMRGLFQFSRRETSTRQLTIALSC